MKVRLEITQPPKSEADIADAQAVNALVKDWAKGNPGSRLEVWVNGLIYFEGIQIGYYDEASGEPKYIGRPAPS